MKRRIVARRGLAQRPFYIWSQPGNPMFPANSDFGRWTAQFLGATPVFWIESGLIGWMKQSIFSGAS